MKALTAAGFDVGASAGPIIPVLIGPPERTLQFAKHLRDQGFLVPAIRPPTVPEGTARLRIGLSAAHDDQDVSGLIDALQAAQADGTVTGQGMDPPSIGR